MSAPAPNAQALARLQVLLAQGAIDQATFDLLSAPHLAALQGSGAIAQGEAAQAVGEKGVGVRGNTYARCAYRLGLHHV
jgi:hypothetical protein